MVTDALHPQRLIGMVQSSDQAQSLGEAPVTDWAARAGSTRFPER